MNDLQIFSSDLIPVYTTDTGERVVLGRELHESLGISTAYKDWFPRMCEYGFSDGMDFSSFLSGRPSQDHILKLDMAKHIAMIQRTPQGKAIRDKLISLETNVTELSPELRLLINLELRQKQQDKALAEVRQQVDGIKDLVTLSPHAWREECRKLLVRVAQGRGSGGAYQEVNAEAYALVDERGGVSLATRLTNKRQRMALEGVCKSKRDMLTKVDIIAEDKKLVEIYIAVVKDMAVKYQAASA